MKEVTLQVNGREMTFSEEELTSILEEHFKKKESESKQKGPIEGEWFKVNPLSIDQNFFKEKREDSRQELTRKIILEAFKEMKRHSKYAKPFKTLMPQKTWRIKKVRELKVLAKSLGVHNADWVEQALEWAQRIMNGESWEDICNKEDNANWYRLVVWNDGYARLVGGAKLNHDYYMASNVHYYNHWDNDSIYFTVPLVVDYDD